MWVESATGLGEVQVDENKMLGNVLGSNAEHSQLPETLKSPPKHLSSHRKSWLKIQMKQIW